MPTKSARHHKRPSKATLTKKRFFAQYFHRGFSLIEILVVATVLIMLTAVLVVRYTASAPARRDALRERDAQAMQNALEQHYELYGAYPVASSFAQLLTVDTFQPIVQQTAIQDPLNQAPYVYSYTSDGVDFQLRYQDESSTTIKTITGLGISDSPLPTPTPVGQATPVPTATVCVIPTLWTGILDPCTGERI